MKDIKRPTHKAVAEIAGSQTGRRRMIQNSAVGAGMAEIISTTDATAIKISSNAMKDNFVSFIIVLRVGGAASAPINECLFLRLGVSGYPAAIEIRCRFEDV